jgi:hypothetical protein
MFFNLYKNSKKNLILDILILFTLIILFIKFFAIIEVYPLHDEVVIIERNTKWHNFLWRNYTSNHTINSFFAVIIKSIFGYNILYYRFISFIFFSLILILFRKLYPSLLLYCIFISIILSSQLLTNYIYIFRGYYSWAFFTVLSFFYLKKFIINNFDNKNYKILLIINLILLCHAIFTLYIVVPIFICLFFIFINNLIKKNNDFKIKEKILNFFLLFLIPLISFYFLIIIIEGFIINHWDNLTMTFFLQNILNIIRDGFVPGFKSIFLNPHLNQYSPQGNFFLNLYTSLINNNLFTRNPQIESQNTIFAVYLVSFFILIYRAFTKKFDYLDLTQATIFIFFYLIHFVPEPRVHVGIVFFNIFYIFNNINLIYIKKIETNFLITLSLLFLAIFYISNTKSDIRYYETKLSIDKINLLKQNNNCNKLNYLLSEYEIWIIKNIYNKDCKFYYDFKNKKNILY